MTDARFVPAGITSNPSAGLPTRSETLPSPPAAVIRLGPAATFAWDEFFLGRLRNRHTRQAYGRAVRDFLTWLEPQGIDLPHITPGMVGGYFDQHAGSIPSKKLALAALRSWFDCLVTRHVVLLNPAASVRGERYQVVEGLTPAITPEQARALLASIPAGSSVDSRDKCVISVLIYTAARIGAVSGLRRRHLVHDGTQHLLRFGEKGGKKREIPVRHDLERLLLEYLELSGIGALGADAPLFPSATRWTAQLTDRPASAIDLCRMVKRRLQAAGLPNRISPHSFRVCAVTDLLTQGVPLEDVQYLAGHADSRTTRLYDRRQRRVSRNVVERISV